MAIRLVKTTRCQIIFCQPNLPKPQNLLYNKAVLILITMAGMKMAALAAGVGAALAGSPEQADAQATGIILTLSDKSEVVVDWQGLPVEVQGDVLNALIGCDSEQGHARDSCLVATAHYLSRQRLDAVIIETKQRLEPLEKDIGFSSEAIIKQPEFCDFAASDADYNTCQQETEAVQLAAVDVQIAKAREDRIAAETRVAEKTDGLAAVETRVATKKGTLTATEAERDANAAVLAALQRVATGNQTN